MGTPSVGQPVHQQKPSVPPLQFLTSSLCSGHAAPSATNRTAETRRAAYMGTPSVGQPVHQQKPSVPPLQFLTSSLCSGRAPPQRPDPPALNPSSAVRVGACGGGGGGRRVSRPRPRAGPPRPG